ncbi:hypothetical protein KAZ57_00065 [Patescibacteria group bacterium]|nr:hypothetical protein [Patescibacteria group bacterium]
MTTRATNPSLAKTQAVAAGVPLVPELPDIPEGNGYRACNDLPAGITLEDVQADARGLARHADLDQIAFVNLVEQFDFSVLPEIKEMLENQKARNAGEVGKRVVKFTETARGFSKKMPQLDPRFVARLEQGKAKGREVLNQLKTITKELANARAEFENLWELTLVEEQFHMSQYHLSIAAVGRDLQISKKGVLRRNELVKFTAIMECLNEELQSYIPQLTSEEDTDRLTNVNLLVVQRAPNMWRMITKAKLGIKRWALQANSNALTAMSQLDFARIVIPDWREDIAAELDAQTNNAMNLAYLEGLKLTDEQAEATAAQFDAQMESMANVLKSKIISMQTIQRITTSLVNYGTLMGTTLKEVDANNQTDAKLMMQTYKDVAASEKEFRAQLAKAKI